MNLNQFFLTKNKFHIFNLVFFFFGLLMILLSFSLHFSKNSFFLIIIRNAYSLICHQLEDRTFIINGKPMLICSRCFGIYAGITILFGIIFFSKRIRDKLLKLKVNFILLLSSPLILDWSFNFILKIDSTNFVRFLTGFLFSFLPVHYLNYLINYITQDD